MKTKTLIILFALVMALSVSAGVFAESAWDQTWDEETVLQYFTDLDLLYPDLFADIDSDFLWTLDDSEPEAVIPEFEEKALSLEDTGDYEAKAPIGNTVKVTATTDPCGDGLIKIEVEIEKMSHSDTTKFYGPENTTYIRELDVYSNGSGLEIAKCTSTGDDNCRSVTFDKKGKAKLTIYAYGDDVYTVDDKGVLVDAPEIQVDIVASTYRTALWDSWTQSTKTGKGTLEATKKNYCQASLEEYSPTGTVVRAKYDQNTGEARFQAFIRNYEGSKNEKFNSYFAIPAEVIILDDEGNAMQHVKDYTCKYTIYNTANGAPRTDYCKYGEGIALSANALIRFDITIAHLSSDVLLNVGKVTDEEAQDIPFLFRVGGMTSLVGTAGKVYDSSVAITVTTDEGTETVEVPAYAPVDYPCPIVSRMQVMDPLMRFMPFYSLDTLLYDKAIAPSGAYGVYEGGLWGMYQKCGKYAYMAVRLMNDGIKDEVIKLDKVAVAINGGTPMSWNWVLTSVEADDDNTITLEPGKDVVLIGRAKVTDYGYQMNSDQAITGAVNFLDYGFYIQGKVYSDHNNTNCTVAP